MEKITQEVLNKMIKNHRHWLRQDCENWRSMRANFTGFDLKDVNFANANFESADFSKANLKYANFENANLIGAVFTGADLTYVNFENAKLINTNFIGANLSCANFTFANLTCASLIGADLSAANFTHANLAKAVFTGADLGGAEFTYANLESVNFTRASLKYVEFKGANLAKSCLARADFDCTDLTKSFNIPFIPMACPEKGSFIGWKKARGTESTFVIVELLIPEDARRSSATGRKCRCDKARVLNIESLDGKNHYKTAVSSYNKKFVYEVGKEVTVPDFCKDRFRECAQGIHFFINREEAMKY